MSSLPPNGINFFPYLSDSPTISIFLSYCSDEQCEAIIKVNEKVKESEIRKIAELAKQVRSEYQRGLTGYREERIVMGQFNKYSTDFDPSKEPVCFQLFFTNVILRTCTLEQFELIAISSVVNKNVGLMRLLITLPKYQNTVVDEFTDDGLIINSKTNLAITCFETQALLIKIATGLFPGNFTSLLFEPFSAGFAGGKVSCTSDKGECHHTHTIRHLGTNDPITFTKGECESWDIAKLLLFNDPQRDLLREAIRNYLNALFLNFSKYSVSGLKTPYAWSMQMLLDLEPLKKTLLFFQSLGFLERCLDDFTESTRRTSEIATILAKIKTALQLLYLLKGAEPLLPPQSLKNYRIKIAITLESILLFTKSATPDHREQCLSALKILECIDEERYRMTSEAIQNHGTNEMAIDTD